MVNNKMLNHIDTMDDVGDPDINEKVSLNQSYQEIDRVKSDKLASVKEFLSNISVGQY